MVSSPSIQRSPLILYGLHWMVGYWWLVLTTFQVCMLLYVFILYLLLRPVQSDFLFFRNFDTLLHYDRQPSGRCILLGDFNHNVHSRSDSSSLRPWQHWVRSYFHDSLRDDPVSRDLPTFLNISTIDFILCTEDLQHLLVQVYLTCEVATIQPYQFHSVLARIR